MTMNGAIRRYHDLVANAEFAAFSYATDLRHFNIVHGWRILADISGNSMVHAREIGRVLVHKRSHKTSFLIEDHDGNIEKCVTLREAIQVLYARSPTAPVRAERVPPVALQPGRLPWQTLSF